MSEAISIRRAATFALAGGLLMAASVAAELAVPVQNPDGTSREPLLHAVYLVAWVAGCALVALAARNMRPDVTDGSRMRSLGAWFVVGGAAALAVSGVGQLIGVLAGSYPEALFILFVIGLPLVAIGSLLLGLALRARGGWAWIALVAAAAGLLVAFAADMDPIHDIGLIGGALAIAAAGLALRTGEDAAEASARTS